MSIEISSTEKVIRHRGSGSSRQFRSNGERSLSRLHTSAWRLILILSLSALLAAGAAMPAGAQTKKFANDSFATALPLDIHGSGLTGALYQTTDMAYYKFSVDAARDITVWLQTATFGSELKAIVALYNVDKQLMAYNDDEFHLKSWMYEGDALLYIRLPAAGNYFLAVATQAGWYHFPILPDIPTYSGTFKINLLTRFDGAATGDWYEPNDTAQTAAPISLPFVSGTTNLLYFGDIDWFRFEAKKGTRLSIDIEALEQTGAPGFDLIVSPRLGLFDARGNLLMSNLHAPDPDTGFASDPALTFDVPADGRYYICVTASSDRNFTTAFKDAEFLRNPYVGSKAHSLGYYQLEVREAYKLYFAHIANGVFGESRFSTSVILQNTSTLPARGELKLYKSDGSPMSSEFPPTAQTGSSFWFDIPPGGASVITTDGKGTGSAGYAAVDTTVPITGTAVFSQFDSRGALVTEAAVAASSGIEFFAFPVDNSGDYNTGLAVANISGSTKATLTLKMVDLAGKTLSAKTMTLEPGTQKAVFVGGTGQLFPELPGVRGSLQVWADQPVYAIALRSTPKTLTTLEPVPMDLPYNPVTLRFPQVVVGGTQYSYKTAVLLTNPGYFPASGTIRFTRADGTPMLVSINSKVSSTHNFSVPAHGTTFMITEATQQLVAGYATLDSDHGIGGQVVYSQYEGQSGGLVTEVAVGPAVAAKRVAVFAQNENGYSTGLAYVNLNATTAALFCQIQSGADASQIQSQDLPGLEAGKQRAQLVAGPGQMFPSFSGNGTLTLTSSLPLYSVALRITSSTMTAIPVIPIP